MSQTHTTEQKVTEQLKHADFFIKFMMTNDDGAPIVNPLMMNNAICYPNNDGVFSVHVPTDEK